MKFKDTVGYFESAFTVEECDALLERFERAKTLKLAYSGQSGMGVNDSIKTSTDFDLLTSPIEDDIIFGYSVIEKFNDIIINQYLGNFPHKEEYSAGDDLFQAQTFYELLQIQEYPKAKGHYNAWHAETGNFEMSRRLFSFLLYLDDVEEGGETDFLYVQNDEGEMLSIQPKKGTLLIHPASFPYIHRGRTPVSGDKTILTTWLSYEPEY
jgi:hypothetical protein